MFCNDYISICSCRLMWVFFFVFKHFLALSEPLVSQTLEHLTYIAPAQVFQHNETVTLRTFTRCFFFGLLAFSSSHAGYIPGSQRFDQKQYKHIFIYRHRRRTIQAWRFKNTLFCTRKVKDQHSPFSYITIKSFTLI